MKGKVFTVITVVYNGMKTLESTINSVVQQDNNLFEYIIVDGCSTDKSLDIIRKYKLNNVKWISEPDKGIYDAMNKAINMATGEWLYFLGADDLLESDILKNIVKYLSTNYVLIFGDVKTRNGKRIPSFFSVRTILQNTIHHQGAFYHKSLFYDFHYDTQLKILSDYELNLKIYLNKLPVKHLSIIVACCGDGGASSNLNRSLAETNFVRSRFLGNGLYNIILSLVLKFYYAQKKIRNKL